MPKQIPKTTPDAIHTAAEAVRALTQRFVEPFLAAATALEDASDALVLAAEAEQKRDRLLKEISALGAELARDQQNAVAARAALPVLHQTLVTELGDTYTRKHETMEAEFTTAQGERQRVLDELERQITDATVDLDRLQRQQTEAEGTHQKTLDGMTTKATKDAQAALAKQQVSERTVRELDERIRQLRGEAQREAARLRELADRAG